MRDGEVDRYVEDGVLQRIQMQEGVGGGGFCINHLSQFSYFFRRKLLTKARHIFPAISLNGTSFYTLLKGHDKENVFLVICRGSDLKLLSPTVVY